MPYQFPPDIQHMVDVKMASGRYRSQDELLLEALQTLGDHEQAVADILEGIEDERAGRLRPLTEVDADIRRELGFAT
jgi:Arc/MetJ-type ribon-helix-helix transcriptional regulator